MFNGARPASLPPTSPPSSTRESVELETVKLEPVELEPVMLEEVRNMSAVGGLRVFRKGRLKGPAALRNAEMERALRLQWSALSESERAMLIEGAHSPAHISQQ